MRRAYSPRPSTVDLIARIKGEVPGVAGVRTIAPTRSAWGSGPTRLRVTLTTGEYADLTLPRARAWLASEPGAAVPSDEAYAVRLAGGGLVVWREPTR